jgi:hypothetical protein
MELSEQPLAVKMLYNSGFMWPSVVAYEHWPVSQRMIVEMGTARGCSDNSMACDVARHEHYRACMGLYWPKN